MSYHQRHKIRFYRHLQMTTIKEKITNDQHALQQKPTNGIIFRVAFFVVIVVVCLLVGINKCLQFSW